ncbi:hypothetical protein GGF31_002110 [Allomyces arbusculus]|nr:hypothetical protein GGF31_002110 [Allomyces arbusculus]
MPAGVTSMEDVLAAHVAVIQAAKNGYEVDKVALNKLISITGERTANIVSRDTTRCLHTFLLATFQHKVRDSKNKANDLAFICSAETRCLAFMDALANAVNMDTSLVRSPPLPPLDVALISPSSYLMGLFSFNENFG